MNGGRWQTQNAFARSVLPPDDEIPTQMSPFSNDRWDRDLEENIRRKEIQRRYVYNQQYLDQPYQGREEPMPVIPAQEPEMISTPIQEPEDIPQVPINPLAEVSSKDYFKKEPPQVLKPKSLHEIPFETPGPPNLYPVLKFPEKRLKSDVVYHLPSTNAYVPRPSGLPEEPPQLTQPPKPEFAVYKDYQPERPKPMHYGVHVPLWQFSSNKKDLTKKNKLGRSLELKVNKKNANAGGGLGSTKCDLSKPASNQSSHEDLAKVLKTLGGISKSLGYKVPRHDSGKRSKKKNSKALTMKTSNSQEFGAKQPKREDNQELTTSTTDLSQTQSKSSLSQKMADVLSCVTNKKPLSELNLLKTGKNLSPCKNGNVSVPNILFVDSTNTSPPKNFSALERKVPVYMATNRIPVGEKSRSSEYFKYMTLSKQPSKSLSFETDHNLRAERRESKAKAHPHSISRNTSESFIRKIDLTKSKDSDSFRNSPSSFTNSFESIDWGKLRFTEPDSSRQQLKLDTVSVDSYSRNTSSNRLCPHRSHLNGNPSCFSSPLSPINTNSKFCCCGAKKEKRDSLKTESDPGAGNDSRKPSKMSMRLCHCPHLHTENAIKKICLHNCLTPQQFYSSKLFRVNYVPKEEKLKRKESSESDMKQHEELVMDGSKTAISKVVERKESSTRGVDIGLSTHLLNEDVKKSSLSLKASDKVISKISLKSRKSLGGSKTEKKEKLKKTRTFPEYGRPNVMLWSKENHVQILGQSNLKKGTSEKKGSERTVKQPVESKPVKESVRRVVRPLSRLRSRDSKKPERDEKALEELAVLEKLFAKLNTVERSLRRQKVADSQHQCRSLSKTTPKNKGEEEPRLSFNQMKSLLMLDSPAEEECQRRRKKLRSAIIRHVQNWIKLDFDDL